MAVKKTKKEIVEVEIPMVEVEEETPTVEIVEEVVKVDTKKKPEGLVKIRMREDHKCTIGKNFYDLRKGEVYTVPSSVKMILNRNGLLLPL